jgi:hypothetical protein
MRHKLKNLFEGVAYLTGIFIIIGGAIVCVLAIILTILYLSSLIDTII